MSDEPMPEAKAMARFGQELDNISARGRAADSSDEVMAIVAENERECAALLRKRSRKTEAQAIDR